MSASRLLSSLCRLFVALTAIAAAAGCGAVVRRPAPREQAITDRIAQYGPAARARLAPFFAAAGVEYPPQRFALLGFKLERELHLLASGSGRDLTFIRSYPIQGMSGTLGPKLHEGDGQVPEGIYGIVYLNPNSVAHLSLALSYPNEYDRARAAEDGRDTLGGDIMIHGGSASSGCLAMGDDAAEELFVLAAESSWEEAVVVLSPVDFRRHALPVEYRAGPPWVEDLYARLRAELERFPDGHQRSSRNTFPGVAPTMRARCRGGRKLSNPPIITKFHHPTWVRSSKPQCSPINAYAHHVRSLGTHNANGAEHSVTIVA